MNTVIPERSHNKLLLCPLWRRSYSTDRTEPIHVSLRLIKRIAPEVAFVDKRKPVAPERARVYPEPRDTAVSHRFVAPSTHESACLSI